MTNKVFFISDTHFGHANILNFKRADGTPLRSFASVEEMDEHMVDCHNSVVRPQDKVYHLGDVALHKRFLPILKRLNGHKRLVRGNHDMEDTKELMNYFEEIYGVRVFAKYGFICSHIPIHPNSLGRWKANVHGHLHSNLVVRQVVDPLTDMFHDIPDERYINVSVEQINYTPISMEELIERLPK